MAEEYTIRRKKVTVHSDGQVFVEGRNTGLYRWDSDHTRWKNSSGRELTELKGNGLEKALEIKGFLR